MFYNPNAIDNAVAVRSTYCLFATAFATAGSVLTVAEVNAAVDGTVAPIVVLFIVVPVTGTVEPEDSIFPMRTSSTLITIEFPASKSKFVPDLSAGIPTP
jgi:hypothetical protein